MINEIKIIVQNYINNAKLTDYMIGTVTSEGIRLNEKVILPDSMVVGNLKSSIVADDKVRLLRNHGGKQYYILEVINT